jgi:hypothetical protein
MNNTEKLYAAYGSNLNLEQMARRCPTADVVGESVLLNHRLVFRGGKGCAVATVEPQEGSSVPMLIWRLKPADEAALDIYEGYPSFYRKETIQVDLDGELMNVMIYIMNEGRPLNRPSCTYLRTILEGYEDAGFDCAPLRKAWMDSVVESREQ